MVGAALAWHRPQLVRVPEAYPLCVFWWGVLLTVPRESCHRSGTLNLSLQPWLALLGPVLVWPADQTLPRWPGFRSRMPVKVVASCGRVRRQVESVLASRERPRPWLLPRRWWLPLRTCPQPRGEASSTRSPTMVITPVGSSALLQEPSRRSTCPSGPL